jgi:hypothetical protein
MKGHAQGKSIPKILVGQKRVDDETHCLLRHGLQRPFADIGSFLS